MLCPVFSFCCPFVAPFSASGDLRVCPSRGSDSAVGGGCGCLSVVCCFGTTVCEQEQQRQEPIRLAVDGLALVYHVMQNAGAHDLYLDLG